MKVDITKEEFNDNRNHIEGWDVYGYQAPEEIE